MPRPAPYQQPSVSGELDPDAATAAATRLSPIGNAAPSAPQHAEVAPPPAPGGNERHADKQLTSFAGIVGTFLEHLECAIHTIIYERDIYPRELFMATRKYSCAVKMCRVPRVNRYIREIIDIVGEQLLEGNVQVISVVILSERRQPLERFNFDVSSFPEVEKGRIHSLLVHESDDGDDGDDELLGTSLADLHDQFRAVMIQLSVCSGRLGRLPENCTFTLMAEMAEDAGPPKDHTRNWVVSEPQSTKRGSNAAAALASSDVKSIPLRTVESGGLNMDVWIEESSIKAKLPV